MATATLTRSRIDPRALSKTLEKLLCGPRGALQAWFEASGAIRQDAARKLFEERELEKLAWLRLKESVAAGLLGRHEEAFTFAHESWLIVCDRSSGSIQALVLTQLAACSRARGDLNAAIRASRRAEALLVADAGDTLPQTLAVRAQLVALLREKGADSTVAAQRRDETLRALSDAIGDAPGALRFQRLVAAHSGDTPPAWALTNCLRWRNVLGDD